MRIFCCGFGDGVAVTSHTPQRCAANDVRIVRSWHDAMPPDHCANWAMPGPVGNESVGVDYANIRMVS